jgi:hypothetical protein
LFVLRRDFGISAHEAENVMPAWEREMLLRLHVESREGGSSDTPSCDPFSQVPEELRGL